MQVSVVISQLQLTARNLTRHHTRTLISFSAIAFGVIALLLTAGFTEWIFWATREAAIQTGLGHIHVTSPGYVDSGGANPYQYLLPEKSVELGRLESSRDVVVVSPRLEFSGLISHGEATLSFIGEGVDPKRESQVNRILPIVRGSGLSDSEPNGIILGAGLAHSLSVSPGDRVVLLVTKRSGGVSAVEATVRGVFTTEVKAYDDIAVRMPIALARNLLRVSGSHVWVVGLDKTENTKDVLERFRRELGPKLQFMPWYDLSDYYGKTVRLLSSQMNVVRCMIGLIIVLSISNLLVMSVLERTGEIGTLMALGVRRRGVLALFLGEGLMLGLFGAALGVTLGMALAWIISAIGIPMPPPPGRSVGYRGEILVTWPVTIEAAATGVVTAVAASLYPAWMASRLNVVDALRRSR